MNDDKIYELLQSISNVYEGWYREDVKQTHVTFMKYYYADDGFQDDVASEEYQAYQFDVWGTDKAEVETTEKKVRKILKKNEFIWLEGNVDIETDRDEPLYHYSDRFSINFEVEDEE